MLKKALLILSLSFCLAPGAAHADGDFAASEEPRSQEEQAIENEAQHELQVTEQFIESNKAPTAQAKNVRVPAGVETLADALDH